jgi:DNA-binding MurR/RpiR family transcriptional regulator
MMTHKMGLIADFLIDRGVEVPVHSINELAQSMGIAPSAIVRFAQSFGFAGFTEMQRLFRVEALGERARYLSRISALRERKAQSASTIELVLDAFFDVNLTAMEEARESLSSAAVEAAIDVLAEARLVGVLGQKRAYPLASYLYYGLSTLDCGALLLDGTGGLLPRQSGLLNRGDALVAISFAPYSPEVLDTTEALARAGIRVIAVTDEPESPLAVQAEVTLLVRDANLSGFRSISVSSTLVQALFVGLGLRLDAGQVPGFSQREAHARRR